MRFAWLAAAMCTVCSAGAHAQATAERCEQLRQEQLQYEHARDFRMLDETVRIRAQECPGGTTFLDAAVAVIRISESLDQSDPEVAERRLQAMDYLQEAVRRTDPPLSETEAALAQGHIQRLEKFLVVIQLVPADVVGHSTVQVDGRKVKLANDRFCVSPGPHTLVIDPHQAEFEPLVRALPTLHAGSTQVLHLQFAPRMASLGGYRILVTPIDANIQLDGRVATPDVNHYVWLSPGSHALEVTAPGYERHAETLSTRAGNIELHSVELKRLSTVEPLPLAPIIVGGAGVALLIAGGVTGAVVVSNKSDLAAQCPNRICLPELKGDVNRTKTLATVTNVLIASGAAALGVGLVWYIALPRAKPERAAVRVEPDVGPDHARVDFVGKF